MTVHLNSARKQSSLPIIPVNVFTFLRVVENDIHINTIEKKKSQLLRSVTFHQSATLCSMTTDHQGATCSSSRGIWDMYSAAPKAKPVTLFCIVLAAVNVGPPC